MKFLIAILIAILPSYILGRYIYKKDTEKKPKGIIVKLIVGSALFSIVAIILEWCFEKVYPSGSNFIQYLIRYLIGTALIEEMCKFLPAYFIGIKNKDMSHRYDAIVYAAFSAIGFATFENILYVCTLGEIGTAIYRMIFSVPGHISFGILMGYFLGIAYQEKKNENKKQYKINMMYSLLIPIVFHGIYDFSMMYGISNTNIIVIVLALILDIIMCIYSIRKVKKVANNLEETEKKNNCGRNLLIIGCIITVALWMLPNIQGNRFYNVYYIKEDVNIQDDKVSVMVEEFEENKVTKSITLNLKIKNLSNETITLETEQFYLMNMNNTRDTRTSSKFDVNNQKLLTINPNSSATTTIEFSNQSGAEATEHLLVYVSKNDNNKMYSVFLGDDISKVIKKLQANRTNS